MEPITTIVSAIGTLFLNGFFEKGGADLMTTLLKKLKQQGKEGLLTQAKDKPTKENVQILEGELVTQINEDQDFEKKVRELVEKLKKEGVIPDSKPANQGKYNTQAREIKGSIFGDGGEIKYQNWS